MTVELARLIAAEIPTVHQTVSARDAILYAVSVGYAGDTGPPVDLGPLYERRLRTVSTFANVLVHPGGDWMEASGIDFTQVVHAEHRLTLHREVPIDTLLAGRSSLRSIVDRGAGKGMFASIERTIVAGPEQVPVATIVHTDACRGDGGCGSFGEPPATLARPPERAPDAALDLPVPAAAAILYRLNGDWNPLHIDPVFAAAGGFARPILHGLCTFGHAGCAIESLAGADVVTSIAARFTAPFYPGETLRTEIWRDRDGVSFRCRAPERDGAIVLDCGRATLAASGGAAIP